MPFVHYVYAKNTQCSTYSKGQLGGNNYNKQAAYFIQSPKTL